MDSIKAIAAATLICLSAFGQAITPEERSTTLKELDRTRTLMLAAIASVSEAQAQKKPAPDRWSVLECVEHLALTERGIFAAMQANLKAPEASEAERAKTKGKATAPVEVAPREEFKTLAAARAAFEAARKATIDFVAITNLPLHSHVTKHFAFGELDVYQWFVLMAGHVERHTKQINEVKATF